MRKIYAALLRFDEDPARALPAARAHTRHWVSRPWGGWPKGQPAREGSFTSDHDSMVRWRTLEADTARLWELQVDEPFPDDESMRQATLVQVGNDGDDAFAVVQVSLRSTNAAMTGGVVYENRAPGIVPMLVDQVPCVDGGHRLTCSAWRITRAEERRFAATLTDATRTLPVLLFLTDPAFGPDQADAVAEALAGLTHVATVERDHFPALRERTGIDLPDGASAYLWWATNDKRARRGPQWFRGDALAPARWGAPAWPVIRTIFGVAAFRLGPPALASQLEAESALRRIRSLEARPTSATADAEMLQAWEDDLVSLERAQRHNAYLELENERIQNDLNALLAAFDVSVAEATRHATGEGEVGEVAPSTLAEAVALAADRCRHLVFLPEATRSAEAWRYQRPEVVLDALRTLDALARSWRAGDLTGAFIVAARAAGLPWRPAISQTAQTQYREDYLRRYGDREIMLGPHLAWGNSPDNALRVYLYLDRDTRTVVVGHVGRHLRDTSNPHR